MHDSSRPEFCNARISARSKPLQPPQSGELPRVGPISPAATHVVAAHRELERADREYPGLADRLNLISLGLQRLVQPLRVIATRAYLGIAKPAGVEVRR